MDLLHFVAMVSAGLCPPCCRGLGYCGGFVPGTALGLYPSGRFPAGGVPKGGGPCAPPAALLGSCGCSGCGCDGQGLPWSQRWHSPPPWQCPLSLRALSSGGCSAWGARPARAELPREHRARAAPLPPAPGLSPPAAVPPRGCPSCCCATAGPPPAATAGAASAGLTGCPCGCGCHRVLGDKRSLPSRSRSLPGGTRPPPRLGGCFPGT